MAKLNQAMTDLLRYNNAIVDQKRSSFDKSHSHATTLDSAWLVPIMVDRVVPGDEKKIRYSGLARMATPLHPTMDEAYLYTWAFYVPDRLWWTHAKEFYGENLDASFNDDGEYQMPSVPLKDVSIGTMLGDDPDRSPGSLSDYIGMPVFNRNHPGDFSSNIRVCIGPWRCYQKIWNDYFRNSSVQQAVLFNDGDEVTDTELLEVRKLRRVCKLPDRFTSALREPQAGADVLLPLGDYAPVVSREENIYTTAVHSDGINFSFNPNVYDEVSGKNIHIASGNGLTVGDNATEGDKGGIYFSNLWADLQNATASSINSLRMAITVQQLLEIDAIGGKRYQNLIYAHFGVFTPDATLQRPELLGLSKTRIGMRQVLQTSATADGSTPLGNASAVSVTNVNNEWICNKGFTEPGYIMVLAAIRPLHSYSQGLDCMHRKLNRYDHYYPVFDNIGNQPIYSSELYADNWSFLESGEDTVFGWKEAWQEYRMMDNRVSGLFRPDVIGTMSSWNYSTNFNTTPLLNSSFVSEDPGLIDRTIAVQSEPQFLLDSYFEYFDTKNMSVHSTPGLYRL